MPARPKQTHRREILKGAAALGLAATLPRWTRLAAADAPAVKTDSKTADPKYNVLFIMSDDMRPELDFYGNALVHSPNLAALAKAGVMFERGYCPFPLCCPSRSATLTGRHVIHTGVYGNRTWFGDTHPELVSLPKYFMQHGYITMHSGKIFHGGIDDTEAWTEGGQARFLAGMDDTAVEDIPLPPANRNGVFGQVAPGRGGNGAIRRNGSDSIQVLQGNGENHGDYHAADRAIQYLRDYKGKYGDKPFFMGFGTVKPHSPPTAPQKWFDQIDLNKIQLPVDFAPSRKVPEGFPEGCLRPRNADLFIGRDASPEEAKQMIQAYYASISWTDWNIGRVIATLDELGLRHNTIVCFSADHGYQLGEKGKWSKAGSLWEEGARVPLIVHAPQAKGNGQVCKRPVETMNFYPTLVELCGLPMPEGQEGRSMTKLLDDPKAEWKYPAFTVWSENGTSSNPPPNPTLTGIGVRVERWRYAEYDLGGPMLLDMENDPHQLKNLAHDARYAEVTSKMSGLLQQYKDGKAVHTTTPAFSAEFLPGAPTLPAAPAAPAKATT
ncbi:MAG TPA: sulfatase [Opitutales bacterium]|nr:sulfatase [Opitutales bacterium]